ncbi:TetR/AcrR family transcriptional regulator [Sphingomonas sp.]|uniref:TetR/AcrR family transcriptional regulator n=1 Tax=Sphingomonas sp. TaxID=28214 RepID=UPI000DB7D3D0|nr:TetR/AcrR family transcriptional regulator [Sphingomonas sp.]PZU06059.1 MAG: TetR family transcriptional regulator [Sphingomonas sp.]
MNDEPKRYHHGDLRRTMLDTALAMLTEENGWQFTLRELARRAGVSHTASYKHFPDKAALLAELALIGMDRLRTALLAARPSEAVTLRNQFIEMSRAYVRFGTENPNLYRLMFSADARESASGRLKEHGVAALAVLVDLIEEGQRLGWLRKGEVVEQVGAAWAHLHGVTLLTLDGLLGPDVVGSDRASDAALLVLLEGLEQHK